MGDAGRAPAPGPTVALSCALLGVCPLEAGTWYQVPGAVMPVMALHQLEMLVSLGHSGVLSVRSILTVLWFWIVFGSAPAGLTCRAHGAVGSSSAT